MAGYIILALVVLFFAVILIRAALFNPKPEVPTSDEPVSFDRDAAVRSLQTLLQCRTVSNHDHSLEDEAEFQKLIDLLPELYPNVFATCEFQRLPDRALLFHWKGKNPGDPTVLMAHYDVVPVEEDLWEKPPFAGVLEEGVLWGRGALDTKVTFNGVLFSANTLIGQGFVPDKDLWFAFSGGEEINGNGAPNIVQYFRDHGIHPALVVDEGGAVVENVFPGVKIPCGLIGIAEKGMMNVQYTVHSGGGHASAPPVHTPVTDLAAACRRIVDHPFKMHITKPVAAMFDVLGRRSTFLYKIIFANLWCFAPVLDLLTRKTGGELNALVRTTTAFTMMDGSKGRNVIPAQASLVSNMRLNPDDTVAGAAAYLKDTVKNDQVEVEVLESFEPSPISQIDCESWNKVAAAVAETWKGCVVAPYLMVQCSDSRHYRDLSDHVYRFSAMDLTAEERGTIHGNNERIRLDCLGRAIEFYLRLIKKC